MKLLPAILFTAIISSSIAVNCWYTGNSNKASKKACPDDSVCYVFSFGSKSGSGKDQGCLSDFFPASVFCTTLGHHEVDLDPFGNGDLYCCNTDYCNNSSIGKATAISLASLLCIISLFTI